MHRPNFDLPGYETIEPLREDRIADLWKSRQIGTDRLVAIRTFSVPKLHEAEASSRFRQQIRDAAVPEKSGIIPILDVGETEDCLYVVTEFVDGYTLGQYLADNGPLEAKTALEITLKVAIGLNEAWQKLAMVHGDIKPDNILIDRKDGAVRVAGFGIVSALNRACGNAELGFFAGTPNYASPEQAGGARALECGTDIYALGATLYHMVTGSLPFGNSLGDDAILASQRVDYLRDPLDLRPSLSPEIGSLIEILMIKDAALRYSQWSQAISGLQNALNGFRPAGKLPPLKESTILRGELRSLNAGLVPVPEVPAKTSPAARSSSARTKAKTTLLANPAKPALPTALSPVESASSKPEKGEQSAPVTVPKPEQSLNKRAGTKRSNSKKGAAEKNSTGLLENVLHATAIGFITAAVYVLARNPAPPTHRAKPAPTAVTPVAAATFGVAEPAVASTPATGAEEATVQPAQSAAQESVAAPEATPAPTAAAGESAADPWK